jgi:hypothetical protein
VMQRTRSIGAWVLPAVTKRFMRDLAGRHAIVRRRWAHLAVAARRRIINGRSSFVEKPRCTMKLAKIHVRKMQEKLKAAAERKAKNAIVKPVKK